MREQPPVGVERVEAWHLSIPLQQPIVLGRLNLRSREFVVVRVTDSDGAVGTAYSLTRGAPTDLVVSELLGPRLVGRPPAAPTALTADLAAALPMMEPIGLLGRGLSLLDIAMWDLAATRIEQPVWHLLTAADPRPTRVMLVAPYKRGDESHEAYAARVEAVRDARYDLVKLYPQATGAETATMLGAVRAAVSDGVDLVVDCGWRWRSAQAALDELQTWGEVPLAWLEDALVAHDADGLRRLRDQGPYPVAAGDEMTVPDDASRLMAQHAVDVLRLDSTTAGGLSGVLGLHAQAAATGLPVSPHAYPDIHRHLVHAFHDLGPLERFPPQSPDWAAETFVIDEVTPEADGWVRPPDSAGLGLTIDWDAVTRLASRATQVAASDV